MLKYNTLYQSLKKVSAEWHAGNVQWNFYWNYLMFFENGTVIEGNINGDDYEKIKAAFLNSNENLTKAKFSYIDKEINVFFSNMVLRGELTFENNLILQSDVTLVWDMFIPIN